MNIALYGGTFNPPHCGHLHVADEVRRLLQVDKVLFIPSYVPPHKSPKGIIPADDRLAMIRLAIAERPYCDVSDIEVASKDVCYTIDTVRALKAAHPDWKDVYFVVGFDSIPDIYTWKMCDVLFEEVTIVVLIRPGYYAAQKDKRFLYLNNSPFNASSTDIRALIRGNKNYAGLLPRPVADYIKAHALYIKR
jgi:nicotinate-nucleotide adenylyltransferase